MKRICAVSGLVFFFSLCVSSAAFGWGSATHACIDGRLGMRNGQKSLDKIYAGMAPDLFNYSFDLPFLGNLYAGTHYDFMNVRKAARSGAGNALAYGFVSHNDVWGADFTAHHAGRTFGQDEGYVIAKARALAVLAPLPVELGIPEDAALELYHNFVETAVDVLVKRICPDVGQTMTSSALFRSDAFPALLARAYAADFAPWFGGPGEAAAAIAGTEGMFRQQMAVYGQVLDQDETTAVNLLSGQMASLAVAFLGAYGVTLPPGVDAAALAEAYIYAAMGLCQDDYQAEVEATIDFVDGHE